METKMTVYGVSLHQGSFQDEKTNRLIEYDHMKFYVLTPQQGTESAPRMGLEMTDIRGDSSLYHVFKDHQEFPFDVEMEVELIKKNGEVTVRAQNVKIPASVALKKSA